MWKIERIIAVAILLFAGFVLCDSLKASQQPASTWDLIRQSMQTESQPVNEQNPTLLELLDKYRGTREKLTTSFIAKIDVFSIADYEPTSSSSGMEPRHTETYYNYEFRYDEVGVRSNMRMYAWGDAGSATDVPEDDPHYLSHYNLPDKYIRYSYGDMKDLGVVNIATQTPGQTQVKTNLTNGFRGHDTFGYIAGDAESIDELLRNPAYDVSVRENTEEIGGSQCYVIDADTDRGKYTLWIDPNHGYNLARAEVIREEGDIESINANILTEGSHNNILENVKFEQIDGVWIAVEADIEYVRDPLVPGQRYTQNTHYELTEYIRDPDHDGLGSFEPDDFKNGAVARVPKGEGIWQDGKVLDSDGQEMDYDN